jgi:uncharacterized protein YndB with AHSA1/START domain
MTPGISTLTTPTDRTIHIERIFEAPRDCVWRAFSEADLLAKWWGRGNPLDVERFEFQAGGHWRFVEHAEEGATGFEGRFREIVAPERMSQTFEWDGMPGHPSVDAVTLVDLGGGRTRVVNDSSFMTPEERDGMLGYGMKDGLDASYAALDRLLATMC